jgi:hypothetical protein
MHYFLGRSDGKRQRLFNGDDGQRVFLQRNLVEVDSKGNYPSSHWILKKGGELCYGKERRLEWNGVEGKHVLVYIGEVDLQQRSKSSPKWFHVKEYANGPEKDAILSWKSLEEA